MPEVRSVHIGEATIKIPPFRAFKAMLAGDIVSRVSSEVMRLIDAAAEYEEEYRRKHRVRLTLDECRARGLGIPVEEFGPDGILELPAMPSGEEKFLAIFPEAYRIAKDELVQLLALVVIPNAELQEAEENEDRSVEDDLERRGKSLLFDAELGELLELAGLTVDIIKEQVDEHRDALGKLRDALFEPTTETEEEPEGEAKPGTFTIEPKPSEESSQSSSTSSPPPTDGAGGTPSTVSPTLTSSG